MWMKYGTYLLPYRQLSNDDRFVIWGYGKIGKALAKQWEVSRVGRLIAVVDQAAATQADRPPFLHAPEDLRCMQFTKVLIAIGNKKAANSIRKQLHAWGIEDDRIAMDFGREVHRIFVPDAWLRLPDAASFSKIRNALQLHSIQGGWNFVRMGNAHDGGYVMLDDFRPGGIAYSFGINDDVTWDRDMADRGYEVFMYDHTIDSLPEEHPAFHFQHKGIAGAAEPPDLDTLEHYVEENHHAGQRHMILKMDVEGAEWKSLLACPAEVLQSFDQIVLELHDMVMHEDEDEMLAMLVKLNRTHAVIHLHANNWGNEYELDGHAYADALEVTYANRAVYDCQPGGEPHAELDAPCCPSLPEARWA